MTPLPSARVDRPTPGSATDLRRRNRVERRSPFDALDKRVDPSPRRPILNLNHRLNESCAVNPVEVAVKKDQRKTPTTGGFANADIPQGFQNPRSRLPDSRLSRRGRIIYYSVVAGVIVGGAVLIWLSASSS